VNHRTLIAGGLAAGLALLLAGCGPGLNTTDGPFGRSATQAGDFGECLSLPRGSVATFGATSFSNSGTGQEKIEKVTPVGPHDLRLLTAWVVPVTGHALIGDFGGYPPYGMKGFSFGPLPPGWQWGERQRADGAVIPHTPGHNAINLLLVVKASGVEGTMKDVYVYYESGGTHYRLDLSFFIQLYNGNLLGCMT
jgi:hypothetical protein